MLISTLGTIGADPAVTGEAIRRFDTDAAGGERIDPDLEGAVLHSVAARVRDGDYEIILERYRNPATPQEEQRYLMALAAFPDVDRSLATFELARTEVRTQNAPYLVGALLGNRVSGPMVWEMLETHWDDLLERFPANSHSRMLDGARSLCADRAIAERVRGFLEAHPVRTGARSVTQMLERLGVNTGFGERVRGTFGATLSEALPDL
jgi:puromycin-sensitive aminopeptidase